MLKNRFERALFGLALGDMVGLPYEGLKAKRIDPQRIGEGFFGKGLFSDDTEHSVIVAQCLIESFDEPKRFEVLLRRRLQLWLMLMPVGVGFATMKGIIKSFFGLQGVYSAGNGSAMRSALIGLMYGDDNDKLQTFVRICTTITHTDSKAYLGALAVAKASYLNAHTHENLALTFQQEMQQLTDDKELLNIIQNVINHLDTPTSDFAKAINQEGYITGYIYHTLPIVLHAWLRNPQNLNQALYDVIICGGDTDTTASIVGGIIGSDGDNPWIARIGDYPINAKLLKELAQQLEKTHSKQSAQSAPKLPIFRRLLRNVGFFVFVLFYALFRLIKR
jgi:ADP-ribosylglycohydrolase